MLKEAAAEIQKEAKAEGSALLSLRRMSYRNACRLKIQLLSKLYWGLGHD